MGSAKRLKGASAPVSRGCSLAAGLSAWLRAERHCQNQLGSVLRWPSSHILHTSSQVGFPLDSELLKKISTCMSMFINLLDLCLIFVVLLVNQSVITNEACGFLFVFYVKNGERIPCTGARELHVTQHGRTQY